MSDISALSGLTNLDRLSFWGNSVSDLSPLSGLINLTNLDLRDNSISDISALSGLTKMRQLYIDRNSVSDISALSSLTNLIWLMLTRNSISDLSPLVANTGLGLRVGPNTVDVKWNPLNHASVHTHIPVLQSRGVTVRFDNRTLTNLVKIAGDDQQGLPSAVLAEPFVVEVRDEFDNPVPRAHVTFTVTAGGGTLSDALITADENGRAESSLTLGPNPGTNTVTVSVTGIQGQQTFNAESIQVPKTLAIISGDDQQGQPGEVLEKPFVVEVRDGSGNPVPGVQVTFTVTAGGGTFSDALITTNENGKGKSTLTLGNLPGTNTVHVSVEGSAEAFAILTIEPASTVEPLSKRLATLGDIKRTALLQNYPNPFNPETWIPYQLADDADVTLSIYDQRGHFVRRLDVGRQKSGDYQDKENAAYWDGRNQNGELVTSGTYYYQLRAGDYTSLRRMAIVK